MRPPESPLIIPGTEGYAEAAARLIPQWAALPFADRHRGAEHLFPAKPARILDIGAGSGEDAAHLAGLGHSVVAAEPVRELREAAMAAYASPRITWLDDSLPDLVRVRASGGQFDLVLLSGVWMHLDRAARESAMPHVAGLMAAGGTLILSLRHGPVPEGRRMFAVSADETIALAGAQRLRPILNLDLPSVQAGNRAAGVTWTRLAFRRA